MVDPARVREGRGRRREPEACGNADGAASATVEEDEHGVIEKECRDVRDSENVLTCGSLRIVSFRCHVSACIQKELELSEVCL